MSETNTTLSGRNISAKASIAWSPEHIPNPVLRSMTTSPNRTGIIPASLKERKASPSPTTSFPPSITKQDPGGTDTAGIPASRSSETTIRLSSLTSCWTRATAGIWPGSE